MSGQAKKCQWGETLLSPDRMTWPLGGLLKKKTMEGETSRVREWRGPFNLGNGKQWRSFGNDF